MAYKVTVFETAAELFDAFAEGQIPPDVYLVHENGGRTPPRLSGNEETDPAILQKYSLELLSWDDVLTEALDRANIDIHYT